MRTSPPVHHALGIALFALVSSGAADCQGSHFNHDPEAVAEFLSGLEGTRTLVRPWDGPSVITFETLIEGNAGKVEVPLRSDEVVLTSDGRSELLLERMDLKLTNISIAHPRHTFQYTDAYFELNAPVKLEVVLDEKGHSMHATGLIDLVFGRKIFMRGGDAYKEPSRFLRQVQLDLFLNAEPDGSFNGGVTFSYPASGSPHASTAPDVFVPDARRVRVPRVTGLFVGSIPAPGEG